jgi:hypothetical protein
MAENISQKQLELEKQKLVELQKQLKATKDLTDAQKQQLTEIDKAIKATDKRIAQAKKKTEYQKLENKEFESFAKKFRGLSNDVQKQLQGTSKGAAVYLSLGKSISREKMIQERFANVENERAKQILAYSYERESLMNDIASEALSQAKATQKAEDELKGISDVERQILDIQNNKINLDDTQKEQLINQLKQTEQLRLKEERLKTIKEEQQGLFDALPESIKGAVGFAQKLGNALKNGALPMVLLASVALAVLSSFTKLDEAAKEFRETTGITNSQMEGIKSDANEIVGQFGYMGVEAKGVFDTVAALKSEFSDVNNFSKDTVAALTLMNTNFGISAENAAKVQGIFEQVGGLSEETAASVGMQVTNMAKLAGVAPSKVFADIAENAEIASTLFKGDVNALAKSAIEARRLGTNLKSVADTAQKLLDFESGIEEELVAATFVGGQFNLSRARALAFEGKIVDAQKEILSQVQRTGNFRQKDYFTQQQLAKAAGMSVEEINKQLNIQDRLSKLSKEERERAEKAIDQGLDISQIKEGELETQIKAFSVQQEQQATLEQLQNAFMGIASTVGSILVPLLESIVPIAALIAKPFQWMADGLSIITDNFAVMAGFLSTMAIYSGIIYGNKIRTFALTTKQAIQEKIAAGFTLRGAIAGIFASLAKIPFGIGLIGAAAAVAGLIGLISKAGDVISPADGKTRISTKEGGLFELSPNDDLIAAPGIASAMSRGGTSTDGGNIELNLSQLSAPLNAVVNEIKALRADMANGKIAVYMDTEKVTSKIGRQVDISTRNNFNLGQA